MIPEVFDKPVQIGYVTCFIYKHPKEGQRYVSVETYRKRYKINNRGLNATKKCYRYTSDGDLIAEYPKFSIAAERLGVTRFAISSWIAKGISSCGEIWLRKPLVKQRTWEYSNRDFSLAS